VALARNTGEMVWSKTLDRGGDVSLLLDGDRLIVSGDGYIYCLVPETGQIAWENPLSGYGRGVASLTSVRGHSSLTTQLQQATQSDD
jgi:outer membrane protein assembly factor BamB